MTTDTIFDLASMTKRPGDHDGHHARYETGQDQVRRPVQNYLPGFNPTDDPRRAQVTIRMLPTHTSGIGGDLSMVGPWGLNPADKAAGIHLAGGVVVGVRPGRGFHYNDTTSSCRARILEQITASRRTSTWPSTCSGRWA